MALAAVADRQAEQTLFTVEGDPRSLAQLAEDAHLAERLDQVRSVADALNLTTRELATLAFAASGKAAPIDLTAQPMAIPSQQHDKWGYILPRFKFGRHLDPHERLHVPEEERDGQRYEYRAVRFEVSKLIPSPVRRWLGTQALFMEIGRIKDRPSQLEKRLDRMHHNEAVTHETTEKAQQARQAEEEARAYARQRIEDRAYRSALKPYAQRERANGRLVTAQAALEEAEERQRRNPSYANERAVTAARESRDRARAKYEVADGRFALQLALGFFRAQIALDRAATKHDRSVKKVHDKAVGNEYRQKHPVVVLGHVRTLA